LAGRTDNTNLQEAQDRTRNERPDGTIQSDEVRELEAQVYLAELRARQVEAENRYLKACAERRELKGVRKDEKAVKKRATGKAEANKAKRKAAARAARRTARKQKKAAGGTENAATGQMIEPAVESGPEAL
jgi:hypothetical protein